MSRPVLASRPVPARPSRRPRWAGAAAALFVAAQALTFVACTAPPGPVRPVPLPADSLRVWVLGTGYHAALLVEQPPGARLGPPGREGAPVVEFAWGDRRFFMESRTLWLPLTLLWPTESVVYVRGRAAAPTSADGLRVLATRRVSPREWRALVTDIERAVVRAPDGRRAPPHPPAEGYAGRFYPGRLLYAAWATCNTWLVHRLAAAGLTRPGLPVVLVDQIPGRLRGFEAVR